MPAPQVTAMPQAGWPSAGVRPARSTAKVSLATAAVWVQPWRSIAAVSMASSSGRSAPAGQADGGRATRPGRPAADWTISPSRRIASSRPKSSWLTPGPRSDASTVPSSAMSATSVLLLPPSIASTAGSGPGLSVALWLSVTPGLRSDREREQRDRGVVVGRLDRRPRQHVVLVGGRLAVEGGERPGRARPHSAHGAEPDEVVGAARAVGDRAELDVAVPGERSCQVGDLALH